MQKSVKFGNGHKGFRHTFYITGNTDSQITLPFRTLDSVNPHFGFHVMEYTEARQRQKGKKSIWMCVHVKDTDYWYYDDCVKHSCENECQRKHQKIAVIRELMAPFHSSFYILILSQYQEQMTGRKGTEDPGSLQKKKMATHQLKRKHISQLSIISTMPNLFNLGIFN